VGRRHALPGEKFFSRPPLIPVPYYTRRLPHWQPPNADFFVTWRLHGSLPNSYSPPPHKTPGEAFAALDRELDRATDGPLWLKNPQVADAVSRVLIAGATEWSLYELLAWVIMSNHVHVLLRPQVPLHKALMNVKSASARAANAILGSAGSHFWQDESYDHWVRDDRERSSIIRYIHNNPVKAGPVRNPEDWPWSSLGWQRMALPHSAA
jgi:putative transposase